MKVRCPYCANIAPLVDSTVVYGHSYGLIYLCRPCGAYVGVHDGTHKPLGSLANEALRDLRKECHAAFDPLWKNQKSKVRHLAYRSLADVLNIDMKDCHIGMFREGDCRRLLLAAEYDLIRDRMDDRTAARDAVESARGAA